MKYQITLEVDTEKDISDLIKASWGALIIDSSNNWKVLKTEEESK